MDARQQRGLVIAALCKIGHNGGRWFVPSQSDSAKCYTVDWQQQSCTCPDHKETGLPCKHLHAVTFTMKREVAADGTVTETKSITFTEEKRYTQNWANYDKAQKEEKIRLKSMLADLCRRFPSPAQPKGGRPRVPVSDRLFAVVFKIYCGLASRRFGSDMLEAVNEGHMSRKMCPIKCNALLESPEMTPLLKELVTLSSLPLKTVETEFAVDSTGFTAARHIRWVDEKYGKERSGRDWVKVHIACGVKTNVVTAVEIKGRDAGDSPELPGLVKATAKNFRVDEVSADKAYLSQENVNAIHDCGGTAFIAPKCNTTGEAGGLFQKMFLYYQYRRDEFMAKYHKRSNVESTFSAIKRKFGGHVWAKTDAAMANEVLCKLVCHNLCCVIKSQIELGIEPEFWGKQTETQAIAVA